MQRNGPVVHSALKVGTDESAPAWAITITAVTAIEAASATLLSVIDPPRLRNEARAMYRDPRASNHDRQADASTDSSVKTIRIETGLAGPTFAVKPRVDLPCFVIARRNT
jgi:hypothetical protein